MGSGQSLALQLLFLFKVSASQMSASRLGLVSATPQGPCDDPRGADSALCQLQSDAADFLDRPADEGFWVRSSVFFIGTALARWRMTAIMAKASMTIETCRCQPCQERVSL